MKWRLLITCCLFSLQTFSQNDTAVVILDTTVSIDNNNASNWSGDPETKTFYSQRLINANTVEVLRKGVMEFKVIHNFGDIAGDGGGIKNFFGLDNAADVKIAFHIGLGNKLNLVAARAKGDAGSVGDAQLRVGTLLQLWELGLKYQFFQQIEKDTKHPLTMTLYANTVISTMDTIGGLYKETTFKDASDRMSQLLQLMIAKKFGKISLQVSPTYLHTNYVVSGEDNNLFALGGALRMPITKKFFLIADYFHSFQSDYNKALFRSHNIHLHDVLGVGVEIVTEGHIFHLNFTNARSILENRFLNRTYTSWGDGQYRWGFTISRKFILFRDKRSR